MKKFFGSILILIALSSSAQLKAGRIFAGGNFGIGKISVGGDYLANQPKFHYKINPYIGVMITKRVGIQLNLETSNVPFYQNERSLYGKVSNKNYILGLSVPIFIPLSEKFYFYASPYFSVILNNFERDTRYFDYIRFDPMTYNDYYQNEMFLEKNISIGITPGFLYFPHKRVGINFGLGNFLSLLYNLETKSGQFDVINLSTNGPTLGINFWFGKVE
ncbi:MAG: hypothetical protein EAZ27_03005 [Cytophagales bacterium]|nr:MAG: hypothetical protein EAZ27_03005 [Cytophagales bacterium]